MKAARSTLIIVLTVCSTAPATTAGVPTRAMRALLDAHAGGRAPGRSLRGAVRTSRVGRSWSQGAPRRGLSAPDWPETSAMSPGGCGIL